MPTRFLNTFEKAIEYLLENEGGFSNDKHDKGGATRYGITIGDASKWLNKKLTVQDMKEFPLETAKKIYRHWYWDTLSLDEVDNEKIAIALFDTGVVRGTSIPARYAQRICNMYHAHLKVDGIIGRYTLGEINLIDPDTFIKEFVTLSKNGFHAIVNHNPTQNKFLKGWLNRANRLLTLIEDKDEIYT